MTRKAAGAAERRAAPKALRRSERGQASAPGLPARIDDSLKRSLLAWYRRSRRDLPWRRTSDPYLVWLSEVMLQQTTVKTATPYYEAFASRFPRIVDLAAATEEEVLALWSGLGYYHRARNLLRAARYLVDRHEGRFPKILEAALAVPGVGLYTASAVLSIAHGVPLPVVDGNVRRVLSRWFALRGPEWRADAAFYNLADTALERKAPGDWNQALMELGATVCAPRKPACPACPVRAHCRAHALGIEAEVPEVRARRAPEDVIVAAALVEEDGRLLLVRRAEGRLLGSMWEVPQTALESRGQADLVHELRQRHGLDVVLGSLLVRARHSITYRRIRVEGYRACLRRRPAMDPDRFCFASLAEARDLPMSSMTRKLLAGLASGQLPLDL